MSNNIREEEALGKAFDARLMGRLLKYAKPFAGLIALCFILLTLITVTDLARPYLMHIAIDDHIKSYSIPMVTFSEEPEVQYTKYNDTFYVRVTKLPKDFNHSSLEKQQILKYEDKYYLMLGSFNTDKVVFKVKEQNGSYLIESVEGTFTAELLDNEAYRLFRANDKLGLKQIALLFLLVITLGFVFNYIQIYLLNYTGQKIIYNMRQELFTHLQKLSLSFYDKNPVGRLVTRVTNDMQNLNEMYTSVLVNLFKDILLLVGIMITMLNMNARVALICFSVIPLIVLSAAIFRLKARQAYRETRVKLAKINATLSENISGMKLIQIFNNEAFKYDEFDVINKEHKKASMQELLVFAVFRPTMDLLYSLALSALIWYGGARVLSGELPFGILFAFVNYIEQFFQPINDLTEKFNILQGAMASSERVFMLLDTEPAVKNKELPEKLGKLTGEIEFKNVWFAYDNENWVLRDVSFKISPGETVAFVGATGAGKTSIISLISRLYDIQKGEILVDGKNIKDIDMHELRAQIGTVLQDVFLFTGDIKSNIRLNEEGITAEKLEEVASFVNADKFIDKLPDKYNEEVKERGVTLSAGQRQLLAFARALAFDPSVLVLDEATSNIDTETEILIQDAINKVIQNRTTIVIAHRLSTVQHSDKIIVLHKGKVREIGTHQELLNRRGMYYDLYLLQYKESFQEITA